MDAQIPAIRHVKNAMAAALLAMTCLALLGADEPDDSIVKFRKLQFLVLESAPTDDAVGGQQSHLLKVCPHYGKIDHDSLKFRMASETQVIKLVVFTDAGGEIRRGDMLEFGSIQLRRLSPGSKILRRLPSGEQEFVP